MERAYIALFGLPAVGLRIRARNIVRLLPKDLQPVNILDAGSGPGVIAFLLASRYPNAEITGVDIVQGEIDASREISRRAGFSNIQFQIADINRLPWEGKFGLVVCVDILEHIENDMEALASLRRATTPGGRLVLHVRAKYRRYPLFRRTVNFHVPTHVRPGYLPAEISDKVQRAGFSVLDCGYSFGFLETLVNNIGYMISRAEKRNKGVYAVAFPLLNLVGWFGRGARPGKLGAGVYVIAMKPAVDENNCSTHGNRERPLPRGEIL
jgi:SAM-dependent methyltransferase